MKKSFMFALIILSIVVIIGVAYILNQSPVSDDNPIDDGLDTFTDMNFSNATQFYSSANTFGLNLLQQFFHHPEYNKNIFFSPYSIYTALSMTYEGAAGNTADEMASVLNIEQDNESFHKYVQSLYTSFNHNVNYTINTANALWIQQDYPILNQYKSIVEEFYSAESTNIDFSNPEQAAQIINQWVENKTQDLIKNLIPSTAIDPMLTKLILTNAIYFNGTWSIQFDQKNTTDRAFALSTGETIQVPTMKLTKTSHLFNYTETDEFQLLELPYSGNDLSMNIILPKENQTISTIINSINEESYMQWLDAMTLEEINIYLPKFTIETPLYSIVDVLKELGIHDAFSMQANFSGIDGTTMLYIKKVLHKAFINVSEKGTEAAAATAVIMDLKLAPGEPEKQLVFDCDHPFIYIIQHKPSGTILFIGTIDNPI